MAVSESFLEFVLDQLRGLRGVSSKRMFGGVGLYCGAKFFGLIDDDTLYLKVGDENREQYLSAGMNPFRPFPDRPMTMSYYQAPASVLENRERLVDWARQSVAVETVKKKPARKRAK